VTAPTSSTSPRSDNPTTNSFGKQRGQNPGFSRQYREFRRFSLQSQFRRENDELNQFLAGKFP
jgi:hypothetical protein